MWRKRTGQSFARSIPGWWWRTIYGAGQAVADPVEALQTKIDQIDGSLQTKMALAAGYKKQLEGMQPTLQEGDRGGPGAPTTLAQAEEKLRVLRLKYTDVFPDVIAQQQLVAALKASPTHGAGGGRAAPNPAYEELQLKLIEIVADANALKKQLASMQEDRAKLQELQKDKPTLIAQYQNITRGYAVLRKNYETCWRACNRPISARQQIRRRTKSRSGWWTRR